MQRIAQAITLHVALMFKHNALKSSTPEWINKNDTHIGINIYDNISK